MADQELYRQLRPLLFSIAYRMVGSVGEAEDIVQEAFLRLHRAVSGGTEIESPKPFLVAVTTRLAIDHLRSARVRRESYVGTWLPEPLVGDAGDDTERRAELADSLSMAFLVLLESLSPVERAVFLLREVFEYGYDEIAGIVGKSESNCRQIFARARRHVDAGRPRFEPSRDKRDALAREFLAASERGDIDGLVRLLAEDVTFAADGGGKVTAVRQPVHGREAVVRLFRGFIERARRMGLRAEMAEVNGQPGALLVDREERLVNVMSIEVADGAVQAVRAVANPDKLRHLGPVAPPS